MTYLVFAIAMAALLQPNTDRRNVAAVYVLLTWAFAHVDPYLGAYECYLVAGAFDVLILMIVARLNITPLTLPIMGLSAASIGINWYGMIVYHLELDPALFTWLGFTLYSTGLFILVTGGPDAWRSCKTNNWLPWIPTLARASGDNHHSISREEDS